jgi:hypothetical protein
MSNFICLFQCKLFRSIKICNNSFKEYKYSQKITTNGHTSGVMTGTLQASSIICLSKMFNLQSNSWIWDSKCANKLRIFTWLLFMDRLNVRNILRRKNHKLKGEITIVCYAHSIWKKQLFIFFSLTHLAFNARATWASTGIPT